jgi:hypothetical protein
MIVINVSEEPTASIFMIKEYDECGGKLVHVWGGGSNWGQGPDQTNGRKENSLNNIKPFKRLFLQGRDCKKYKLNEPNWRQNRHSKETLAPLRTFKGKVNGRKQETITVADPKGTVRQ